MKNLHTFTKEETTFFVSIVETGWIHDVFLIITDEIRTNYKDREFKKIEATHIERKKGKKKTSSIFEASYSFEEPSPSMFYFFIYCIEGVPYMTVPTRFTVDNY